MTAILAKDLRRTLRSGFFLMVGIVTPLALSFVLSLVFGGAQSGNLGIPVGFVAGDRGLDALAASLARDGVIERHRVARGTDPAAADLTAVVTPGASIEIVAASDRPTSAGIVRSIVTDYARGVDRERIAARAGIAGGGGPVELVAGEQRPQLDSTTAVTAAMASLFVFIIALVGVSGILEERKTGTLARLLAAPVPRWSVLAAKTLVSLVVSLVAVSVLIAASTLLMDADWGAVSGLVGLVLGLALAATGLTLLIAGFARSIDAAAAIQSTVAIALALLGGAMMPLPEGPVIDALSALSPHHWFLDGLDALAGGSSALPDAAVLVLFAAVLGVPGAVLTMRRLTP